MDNSGIVGLLALSSILLVLGSSARSLFELRISCGRRSAGNSLSGGSTDEFDAKSWGWSIPLVLVDLCFTIKVAPIAQITIAAGQPTTMSATTPWPSPDVDFELDEVEWLGWMVEFEEVRLVVLEGSFDLASKISFQAADVHDSGYLLPLEPVRNRKTLENQVNAQTLYCDISWQYLGFH